MEAAIDGGQNVVVRRQRGISLVGDSCPTQHRQQHAPILISQIGLLVGQQFGKSQLNNDIGTWASRGPPPVLAPGYKFCHFVRFVASSPIKVEVAVHQTLDGKREWGTQCPCYLGQYSAQVQCSPPSVFARDQPAGKKSLTSMVSSAHKSCQIFVGNETSVTCPTEGSYAPTSMTTARARLQCRYPKVRLENRENPATVQF